MKTWMTALALVAMLVGSSAATGQGAQPVTTAALEGTWTIVSLNGQPLDADMTMTISFKGGSYSQAVNGNVLETGTFKLDATKTPMILDLTIVTGDDAGKAQLGIVEVTGQEAKFGLAEPGATSRPTGMADGSAAVVAVGKRVQ
jgi:uncharacterized protein (TIGR03067 family)